MLARHAVLLTPPKSSRPPQLLFRQQLAPTCPEKRSVTPLAATLMDLPASVANKRLTAWLSPLAATYTKNIGRGRLLWLTSFSLLITPQSIPFPFFVLRTVFRNGALSTSLESVRCTLFLSRRRVYLSRPGFQSPRVPAISA